MDIEDTDRYVLDVKNTLISNIPHLSFAVLIGAFMVLGADLLTAFELAEIRLLGFIVYLFSVVRLMGWLQLPNLEYKPRLQYFKRSDQPSPSEIGGN